MGTINDENVKYRHSNFFQNYSLSGVKYNVCDLTIQYYNLLYILILGVQLFPPLPHIIYIPSPLPGLVSPDASGGDNVPYGKPMMIVACFC